MDFLKRLFGRNTQQRNYSGGTWVPVGGGSSSIDRRKLLDHNTEWVGISVDKVAHAVASVRFKVMRFSATDDDQEVFQGPMVDFLDAPGDDFTGKDFLYLTTAYKELTGNAFWEIEKGKRLKPLLPTQIRAVTDSTGQITAYKYTENGTERTILKEYVLHDRYVDPKSPYWGVGKLEKIAQWVDTSTITNQLVNSIYKNGAQFGGFIETEEESEERIKLIKAGLKNDHVGPENAGKWAVLPRGAKATRGVANLAELQFADIDEKYRDKILSAFGVPKTLVGFTTEVNRASAEASEYIFAKYTVKPAVDDLIDFLNNKIAPLLDPSGKLYFAYDEFIPENMEIKLREREISLGKLAYKTVNEVRAELGLPPVEGGDTVYQPNGMPLGEKPPVPSFGPGGNDDQPQKHAPFQKRAPRRAREAQKRIKEAKRRERAVERIAETVAKALSAKEEEDPDAVRHRAFVSRVDEHEKRIEERIKDFNARQKAQVLQDLNRITKTVSKSDVFNMETEVAVLVDFISPLLHGLMIDQAIEEYLQEAFPGTFDQEASSIGRVVDRAAKRLARSYNDTTATLLKKALNEGIEAGEGLDGLIERVSSVYEYSDAVRAAAVARTESVYIANEGNREAYRQSGVVKSVRWYTAEDERVCAFCGPMNGKVIGINDVFYPKGETITSSDGKELKLDYRTIDVPPLHVSCRCFIRPEDIDIS